MKRKENMPRKPLSDFDPCPDDATLRTYVKGQMDDQTLLSVLDCHLEFCPLCRAAVSNFRKAHSNDDPGVKQIVKQLMERQAELEQNQALGPHPGTLWRAVPDSDEKLFGPLLFVIATNFLDTPGIVLVAEVSEEMEQATDSDMILEKEESGLPFVFMVRADNVFLVRRKSLKAFAGRLSPELTQKVADFCCSGVQIGEEPARLGYVLLNDPEGIGLIRGRSLKWANSLPALLKAMTRPESNDFRTLRQAAEDDLHHPTGMGLCNYVLGRLDQGHSLRVLDHVVICGRCLEKVVKIQQIKETLTKYVLERADQLPSIKVAKEFTLSLSLSIWNEIREILRQRRRRAVGPEVEKKGWLFQDLGSFFSPLRRYLPAIGLTVLVLAVLTMVLLPHSPPSHDTRSSWMAALSTVSWNHDFVASKSKFPPNREKVAFLVLLKNFKTPMSQEQIDSLYQDLKPNEREQLRYDVVNPRLTKKGILAIARGGVLVSAIRGGIVVVGTIVANRIFAEDRAKSLPSKLGVQKIVLTTLAPKRNQINVQTDIIDAKTGKRPSVAAEANTTLQELNATVRRLAYNSLEEKG